jgi:hypothetical protein
VWCYCKLDRRYFLNDAVWDRQWRFVNRALTLTSHSSRIYRCTTCTTATVRFSLPSLCTHNTLFSYTMASRRTCLGVLKWSEGLPSRLRGASSGARNFTSETSNWTFVISQGCNESKKRLSAWTPQAPRILQATTQPFLRQRRLFSSSPAPRHGHLDAPKPGEECVYPVFHYV